MATYILPSNVEAERSVLGAILMSEEAAMNALTSLNDKMFSGVDKRNILVFNAMYELYKRGDPIDAQTVTNVLTNNKRLEEAGGIDYLFELVKSDISPDNVDHYVGIIKDQALLREYLLKMQKIENDYAEGKITDIGDFMTASTAELSEISGSISTKGFVAAKDLAPRVERMIERESARNNEGITGVNTGYRRLNQYTHGWQKGNLIVIAARPSIGKTALGLNLCVNAATSMNKPVAFFSCEMSGEEIMKRMLSAQSNVPLENIQIGRLDERQRRKISTSVNALSKAQLFIDDASNPPIGDIVSKVNQLRSRHPDLCMIAIDYVGLIKPSRAHDSRANEVAEVTRTLKEIARTAKIPVIVLAQLNRGVDDNLGSVPKLSNLKESGALEQDADIAILMYRRDYYDSQIGKNAKGKGFDNNPLSNQANKELEEAKEKLGKDNGMSVVTLNIAKNRNGKTGPISLMFDRIHQRFDNCSLEVEKAEAKRNNTTLEDLPEETLDEEEKNI